MDTLTAAALADRVIAGGETTAVEMRGLLETAPRAELYEAAHRVT